MEEKLREAQRLRVLKRASVLIITFIMVLISAPIIALSILLANPWGYTLFIALCLLIAGVIGAVGARRIIERRLHNKKDS